MTESLLGLPSNIVASHQILDIDHRDQQADHHGSHGEYTPC